MNNRIKFITPILSTALLFGTYGISTAQSAAIVESAPIVKTASLSQNIDNLPASVRFSPSVRSVKARPKTLTSKPANWDLKAALQSHGRTSPTQFNQQIETTPDFKINPDILKLAVGPKDVATLEPRAGYSPEFAGLHPEFLSEYNSKLGTITQYDSPETDRFVGDDTGLNSQYADDADDFLLRAQLDF